MDNLKSANFKHAEKAPLELLPSKPLRAVSSAALDGAIKYGHQNWRNVGPGDREMYKGALMRHVTSFVDLDESDYAEDSKVHHLSHAVMCCLILLYIDDVDFHLPASFSEPERVQIIKTPDERRVPRRESVSNLIP